MLAFGVGGVAVTGISEPCAPAPWDAPACYETKEHFEFWQGIRERTNRCAPSLRAPSDAGEVGGCES